MAYTILILDDEPAMCDSLSRVLTMHGYGVESSQNPLQALECIRTNTPDLLITDLKMPGLSGLSVIQELHRLRISIPTIMISGYASVENVVEAMRYGARNFYEKPVRIPQLLEEIARYANAATARYLESDFRLSTRDPRMLECMEIIRRTAPTDASVVVTGESGTGKELVAKAIHEGSRRKDGPFIKINCASIPETLMESELFGHEKGAFTDAREMRPGKFEAAENGTLFFDEIGEMSPKMQVKLLRVLQEREFERVGSNETRTMNVRFIAATNRDLMERIAMGEFREDLYYRLAVVPIALPPLRERGSDVELIADTILREMNAKYDKHIIGMSPEVCALLKSHQWPGNVRELRNCLERSVIFCDSAVLNMACLPEQYRKGGMVDAETGYFGSCLEDVQEGLLRGLYDNVCKDLILETLRKNGGSRQKTAEQLGINRRTLYNKIKRLGIE